MCCGTTYSNTTLLSLLAIRSSLGTSCVHMTSSLPGPAFPLIPVKLIQTPDLHNCMKSRSYNCPHQAYLRVLTDASVQFSRSVVSDSLRPLESQHTRPPCPSPTPRVHSDSCLLSQWCHPTISSSVVPFSSCPQSLPASESFPMSQVFAWGSQSTRVSSLAPFKYDLNQIPYDYTVEVRNRFKGLDLIDRMPDELWTEVRDIRE